MKQPDVVNALAGLVRYRSIDDDDLLTLSVEPREVPPPVPGRDYYDLQIEKRVTCVRTELHPDTDTEIAPRSYFRIDEFSADDEPVPVSPETWAQWQLCLISTDQQR